MSVYNEGYFDMISKKLDYKRLQFLSTKFFNLVNLNVLSIYLMGNYKRLLFERSRTSIVSTTLEQNKAIKDFEVISKLKFKI